MNPETLTIYQTILEQLQHCQAEIDYTRYLSNKPNCTLIIENKQSFTGWSKQLQQSLENIQESSSTLETGIHQGNKHENTLNQLESAVDQLIQLHTDITASCAHDADLMEGRYLIEHAVGHYLDQISSHINEFRYQLNQQLFNCKKNKLETFEALPIVLPLVSGVEMKAFDNWLRSL